MTLFEARHGGGTLGVSLRTSKLMVDFSGVAVFVWCADLCVPFGVWPPYPNNHLTLIITSPYHTPYYLFLNNVGQSGDDLLFPYVGVLFWTLEVISQDDIPPYAWGFYFEHRRSHEMMPLPPVFFSRFSVLLPILGKRTENHSHLAGPFFPRFHDVDLVPFFLDPQFQLQDVLTSSCPLNDVLTSS